MRRDESPSWISRGSLVVWAVACGCSPGMTLESGTTEFDSSTEQSPTSANMPTPGVPGSSDGSAASSNGAAASSGSATETTGPSPFTGCAGNTEAHATLDAFWSRFDRDYALFDLRLPRTTWEAVGADACAAIGRGIADEELFGLLLSMARELDDGHVQLEAPALGLDGDGWVTEYPYYDEVASLELLVESTYLDGELTWAAEDWFAWGSIGEIGYVSITSMDGLSPSEDEDDDRAAANMAMQDVLTDLGGAEGLIIDVRANGGGWDRVALDIARWLAGTQTLAWSEQLRDGPEHDDFSAWEDVDVQDGHPGAFAGPVILLTSGGTFSAAETFALAARVRDNVTLLGERSSGHFSDLFDGELPNGWSYTLSAERYRAADGTIYETLGVPVDVEMALDVAALRDGRDPMLEAALAQLGQ